MSSQSKSAVRLDQVGKKTDEISVEISTRFLEHFSEQLYSSPQKAFEELISNGWDAGASNVDVRVSSDLDSPEATLSVLDNGASMNEEGLKALWHIAFSEKETQSVAYGRPVIGKFGIGKLATYVLANKLTYFCKARDGKIRRVTMDYGQVQNKGSEDRLISQLGLDIFEVTETELKAVVSEISDGEEILKLINAGIPTPELEEDDDEFRAGEASFDRPPSGTWTLAILSDLKPTGRELKIGILRRMLSTALPFGSEMAISLNGELLRSSKMDSPVLREWVIGPDLEFSEVRIAKKNAATDDDNGSDDSESKEDATEVIPVTFHSSPEPHAFIDGIGKLTGTVRLFEDRISTGKSEARGASNGFHVNVLGRVVNQSDPSFGEENLSHAAWARFRMAVRADGLNTSLITNREQFKETRQIAIFRAFLRRTFNLVRTKYDSDPDAGLSDGGDLLVKALGVISLNPLRSIVSDTLANSAAIPEMFDESNLTDRAAANERWRSQTAEDISNALGEVRYETTGDDEFVKFRISDSAIVVNSKHPFVLEHSKKAEKELIRTFAMVNLLTDVYALEQGIDADVLKGVRDYRDKLLRYRARQTRRSGHHIASLLLAMQNDHKNHKRLEAVVTDALSYLGFDVTPLGKPGEPEGYADAFPYPTRVAPTANNPNPPAYRVTYDAKSAKGEASKTGNLSLDGVHEHKERYDAQYALVVAPGFQDGAVVIRCGQLEITPIVAKDLGRLLEFTAKYGAIPLTKLEELFKLHDPVLVSNWVDHLEDSLQSDNRLTLNTFLEAIKLLRKEVPDALSASLIAHTCRRELGAKEVQDRDVVSLAKGLAVIVPDLVGVDEDKVIINASADRVAEAVHVQLESLSKAADSGK